MREQQRRERKDSAERGEELFVLLGLIFAFRPRPRGGLRQVVLLISSPPASELRMNTLLGFDLAQWETLSDAAY